MRKVVYSRYGGTEVLEMVEQPSPIPSHGQVLVNVKAVALNPLDWKIFEGQMAFVTGSKFPRGVGIEFAGEVAETGPSVSRFKPGDPVFGMLEPFKGGALGSQVLASEQQVHVKPAALSFEQAAALPIGGLSALQILDDLAQVGQGTEVLINGATGGIGTLATQMAKHRGAVVTAVVGQRGVPLATRWRCDHVVERTSQNVLSLNRRFDVVIDLSDKLPFAAARPLMKPLSVYVNAYPNPKDILLGYINNAVSDRKRRILMMKPHAGRLEQLGQQAGDWLEVVIGATYPMGDFRRAYSETKARGSVGKTVFVVS
jgi:NADPH:quinone reductase-like Zn-dependent oxidoreductase